MTPPTGSAPVAVSRTSLTPPGSTLGPDGGVALAPLSAPATTSGSAFTEPASGSTSPPLAGLAGGRWVGEGLALTGVGAAGAAEGGGRYQRLRAELGPKP